MADRALAARLVANRVGVGALTLLIVSAVIFTITNLLPGDAAQEALGQSATAETVAALRAQYGLDQPGPVRYAKWLGGMLAGNLGQSFTAGMPVADLIATRLPKSLLLAAVTAAVSVPIALAIGPMAFGSACRRATRAGRAPLSTAISTYEAESWSITAARVMRAICAMTTKHSVITGIA